MSDRLIGLQFYSVRDLTAQDFAGTIRRVAELGYAGVEFAGYGNLSSSEMAVLLQETGLQVAGTHVRLETVEENIEREMAYCLEIGCPNLIIPLLPQEVYNAKGFRELAPRMNEIGRRCHEQGLTFGFHNHSMEFAQVDGKYLLDILLDNTDPSYLKLELDIYWAAYAGIDLIAYLGQRAGRVATIHIKDMTPERAFIEVGNGMLDIAGIVKVAQAAGVQWYIVENDAPTIPPLESAYLSLENLKNILG
jgi:sugar phosphate isomerase/epimerase